MVRGGGQLKVCFLAGMLCACTDPGQGLVEPPTETPTPERVVVVAGDGDHLLAFDPTTSTFEPLGPPAPSVGAYSRIRYAIVRSNPTRLLVVLAAAPDGPEGAFVSDGGEWHELAEAKEVLVRASDTLDLLWVVASHAPWGDDVAPQSVAMHRFDGRVLFERSERPRQESARLIEFGPGDAWFLLQSHPEGYAVHFVDGAQVSLLDEAGNPRQVFEASMITQHTEAPTARWRDLTGQVIERAGFTDDAERLSYQGPYQLVDGALSLLTNDGVQPLQRLPGSVSTFELRQHEVGRYTIVEEQDGLTAYAVDGSAFARYDAPQLPRQTHTNVWVSSRLPGTPSRYIVSVEAYALEGDAWISLERSVELWTIEEGGGSSVVPLARRSFDSNLTHAVVTSSAYFYVEDGRLVQVDYADGARHEWTHEGGILDSIVYQPQLPRHP